LAGKYFCVAIYAFDNPSQAGLKAFFTALELPLPNLFFSKIPSPFARLVGHKQKDHVMQHMLGCCRCSFHWQFPDSLHF
jgi:hypothetical protein